MIIMFAISKSVIGYIHLTVHSLVNCVKKTVRTHKTEFYAAFYQTALQSLFWIFLLRGKESATLY